MWSIQKQINFHKNLVIGDTEKSFRRNYKNNFLNQKPSYDAMSLVIAKSNYSNTYEGHEEDKSKNILTKGGNK